MGPGTQADGGGGPPIREPNTTDALTMQEAPWWQGASHGEDSSASRLVTPCACAALPVDRSGSLDGLRGLRGPLGRCRGLGRGVTVRGQSDVVTGQLGAVFVRLDDDAAVDPDAELMPRRVAAVRMTRPSGWRHVEVLVGLQQVDAPVVQSVRVARTRWSLFALATSTSRRI